MAQFPVHTRLYDILNLQPNATSAEIKRAYKQAALRWHPVSDTNLPQLGDSILGTASVMARYASSQDKNPTCKELAAEKFKQAAEAYAVLSDPAERRQYVTCGMRPGLPSFNMALLRGLICPPCVPQL